MSKSCNSVEEATKNSTVSIPHVGSNELVQWKELLEDFSCLRPASKRTLCDGDICLQCLQLDFQKIAKILKNGLGARCHYIEDVGHRYRQPIDTGCQLCLMLSASRPANELFVPPLHSFEQSDGLYAYSFLNHSNLHNWNCSTAENEMRKANDSLCLAVLPKELGHYRATLWAHGQREGYLAMSLDENRASMFAAQIVPSQFDPAPVRTWLDYCERHHKTICPSPKSQPHGLQLIDCETLAIQDAVDDEPYVALSYVWGSASNNHNQGQNSNGRNLVPSNLPLVISDAISVTKAIGLQYLWIDKFCIDQTNANTKHDQIQQMGAIYENAQLTIIAAAGADENYGLPGVGTRPRIFQPTARAGKVEIINTMRDPHNSIRSSRWFSRGWTFQEAILSRRRLVFTEEQVYFECNAMNCFESIHTPLETLHINNKSRIRDSIRAGIFGRNEKQLYGNLDVDKLPLYQSYVQYLTAVEEYSARELGYDQDSLNAFKGIIRQFSKRKIPILSIWGISYPASIKPQEQESYFVDSLAWSHTRSCWEDSGKPRRRPEFPSWSWVGWAGEVKYEKPVYTERSVYTKKSLFVTWVRSVAFEDRPGTLTTLFSASQSVPQHENHLPRVLCIKAMVVPQNLISYNDKHRDPEDAWTVCAFHARLFLSWGSNSEAQFYQELKEGYRWQCIVVGESNATVFIMILETHIGTGVNSRAGLLVVYPPTSLSLIRVLISHEAEWRTHRIE